ncbi:MAG TPA: pitrilysin family protein [Tepidisphaeraceae bacterium]|nr:pitrilysin family protein [Tepidisphaeraceae bacterium]
MYKSHRPYTTVWLLTILLVFSFLPRVTRAADRIDFTQETLSNGLRVIYAPLRQAPVVHVRVLYHVGSRDERPDRQGFAHMFEHMMFRGSEHVKPEEHMKLIGMVGGDVNAFTSFDQTVYFETIPSNQLELALYLEADRMASFKVSDEIFNIERRVVAEEWRRRQNALYGSLYEDFFGLVFTTHPYRWTPIGNMDHLRAARAQELQDFFNTYYIPNNAVLVIAGDFDTPAAQALVKQYFDWIPRGADIQRNIPKEPVQTAAVRAEKAQRVPLAKVLVGYKVPPYRSDDHYALALLSTILGGGNSSRLENLLVNGDNPLCVDVGTYDYALEDGGYFNLSATILSGRDPVTVEKLLTDAVTTLIEKGVTPEELEKAKIQERVDFVRNRETADKVASSVGYEALIGGDANRANAVLEKINAVTSADIQAVARKYLQPSLATTYYVKPDPKAQETPAQPVAAAKAVDAAPVAARTVNFPAGYPTQPPLADANLRANFAKGTETTINGVQVIVMPDPRLPSVSWNLTMRTGSHSDPAAKEGLASLTAELVRRGAAGLNFIQLNEDLESRGITLDVGEGGDFTRLSGSCLTDQLDAGIQRSRDVLLSPTLPAEEFEKLKNQSLSALKVAQASPDTAASQELADALFASHPFGKYPTPASVASITLADVKAFYDRAYRPNDAIFIIAGDITVERGQQLAHKLLDGWQPAKLASPDYTLKPLPAKRRIILVDRPEGKQSMIRMAIRSYDVQSDEKYAGSLASSILSSGIDSRLGRYVRAEKGYAYSVSGRFRPDRHAGEFLGGTETDTKNTADAIEAMFKVFTDLAKDGITEAELKDAKLRAVGGMVKDMQTIRQQAAMRVNGILNGYPIDYYDRYPERIAAVASPQVSQVVKKYVATDRMTVVVVAPAAAVKDQLQRLGDVEIVPMPSQRNSATTQPVAKDSAE